MGPFGAEKCNLDSWPLIILVGAKKNYLDRWSWKIYKKKLVTGWPAGNTLLVQKKVLFLEEA